MAVMENCYTSCGCNRTPFSVSWAENDRIAYGSCHAVAFSTVKDKAQVCYTRVGHKDRVNSVRWIKSHKEFEEELISGSTDKTAVLWKKIDGKYDVSCVLRGHQNAITQADAIHISEDSGKKRTIVATVSVDSTLKLWQKDCGSDSVECTQTIPFGNGFMIALAWTFFPGTNVPLLACGGDDQIIYLMVEKDKKFVVADKLVGHEDWIRDLHFTLDDSGDLLLASGSQDCFIRIWRISKRKPSDVTEDKSFQELDLTQDIKAREDTFSVDIADGSKLCFAVSVESVLSGHENWVYSVRWQPPIVKDGKMSQPACLLSASMDKTIIVWQHDSQSGMWLEQSRLGSMGGNTLGLYGAVFSPDGKSVLAHGYHGAFHLWRKQEEQSWLPGVVFGGHYASVQDTRWEPVSGKFLLSVSEDQTTRLHAPWIKQGVWHEIARPQVHGYNMSCLAVMDQFSFVSGADEKVLRVFKAPKNFLENMSRICGLDINASELQSAPEGASVPALGLSNKAVFTSTSDQIDTKDSNPQAFSDQYKQAYFSPLLLSGPPTEEDLVQNTLWPETQKLYGHGYEVFSVAAHPHGSVVATSCKAAKSEHAGVIIWDTSSWRQLCTLPGHALTVTDLAFSHNGRYLLSVSRDRTWCLYQQQDKEPVYQQIAFSDKISSQHARIIWSCAWSHDDHYFVTVSRDKKAVVWGKSGDAAGSSCLGDFKAVAVLPDLPDSVTAVDFAPMHIKNSYLLAFGFDSGIIELYTWNPATPQSPTSWCKYAALGQSEAHHLTVKRLQFSPKQDSKTVMLASCGCDHFVRVYTVPLIT